METNTIAGVEFSPEMADGSVTFKVRPWCKPADYFTVRSGVTIPFPQRGVHLTNIRKGRLPCTKR
ncbi:hypothetical protein PDESU_00628 [Pontiella desulfatans]|uniref:Uncharacterized protein n=1 Tax=Pontiella desulfatans TaxID=2750659 RepID=A0A6C2TWN2_PONDE|nr:hypothetical protein PDESU_00628 [Pontiella desulfatans]